jgi:hypothetical protein
VILSGPWSGDLQRVAREHAQWAYLFRSVNDLPQPPRAPVLLLPVRAVDLVVPIGDTINC